METIRNTKKVHDAMAGPGMCWVVLAIEVLLIITTVAALADNMLDMNVGLGWTTFFCGLIGSAWGAVFYQLLTCKGSASESDGDA